MLESIASADRAIRSPTPALHATRFAAGRSRGWAATTRRVLATWHDRCYLVLP